MSIIKIIIMVSLHKSSLPGCFFVFSALGNCYPSKHLKNKLTDILEKHNGVIPNV